MKKFRRFFRPLFSGSDPVDHYERLYGQLARGEEPLVSLEESRELMATYIYRLAFAGGQGRFGRASAVAASRTSVWSQTHRTTGKVSRGLQPARAIQR